MDEYAHMSRRRIIQPDTRTYQQRLEAAAGALAPAIVASLANIRREVRTTSAAVEKQDEGKFFFNPSAYNTYRKRGTPPTEM